MCRLALQQASKKDGGLGFLLPAMMAAVNARQGGDEAFATIALWQDFIDIQGA